MVEILTGGALIDGTGAAEDAHAGGTRTAAHARERRVIRNCLEACFDAVGTAVTPRTRCSRG